MDVILEILHLLEWGDFFLSRSTIKSGAKIQSNSVVAAGSVISENAEVKDY